jgi:hypothetical protein
MIVKLIGILLGLVIMFGLSLLIIPTVGILFGVLKKFITL